MVEPPSNKPVRGSTGNAGEAHNLTIEVGHARAEVYSPPRNGVNGRLVPRPQTARRAGEKSAMSEVIDSERVEANKGSGWRSSSVMGASKKVGTLNNHDELRGIVHFKLRRAIRGMRRLQYLIIAPDAYNQKKQKFQASAPKP